MIDLKQYYQDLATESTPESEREMTLILFDILDGVEDQEIADKIEANFYKDFVEDLKKRGLF